MTKEELEKEAKEYLRRQTQLNGGGLFHCNILNLILGFAEPREKRIADLEKENAELKAQCDCEKCYSLARAYRNDNEKQKEQLTKAKEIISEFIEWANWQGNSKCPSFKSIQDKAEAFLNSEVEK